MNRLRNRLPAAHATVLTNSASLMGSTLVTSGLGFVYWWLAAHSFRPTAVGLASAAISAMTLLGALSILGLGTLLMGELSRQTGRQGELIGTACVTSALVGAALGVGFALAAPLLSPDLRPLSADARNLALFAAGVALTALTMVLDQSLIGLLRGGMQFGRNMLFACFKLAALFLVARALPNTSGLSVYGTWAAGNLLSLVVLLAIAARRGVRLSGFVPRFALLRHLGRPAVIHHTLNLALQAPGLVLPLVVTVLLSTVANAYFYATWMVAGLISAGLVAITTVLYAAGSANPSAQRATMRLTLSLSFAGSAVAVAALGFGADRMLGMFGAEYAENAALALRILALEAFPLVIKGHYIAINRLNGNVANTAIRMSFAGLFELTLAAAGAKMGGLSGLAVGLVAAYYIEGALMFRAVYNAIA